MKRRSFLGALLAAAAAPIAVAQAIARPVTERIPQIDIKLNKVLIETSRRKLRARWYIYKDNKLMKGYAGTCINPAYYGYGRITV